MYKIMVIKNGLASELNHFLKENPEWSVESVVTGSKQILKDGGFAGVNHDVFVYVTLKKNK